jgi:hypothetical protein
MVHMWCVVCGVRSACGVGVISDKEGGVIDTALREPHPYAQTHS